MARRKLTPLQERFVEEYLVDLNATQAVIRAGYSPKAADSWAAQLLRNPKVSAAIAERRKKIEENTWLTTHKVLTDLEQCKERALELGDMKAAIKAVELFGKYLGLWKEKHEHKVTHTGGMSVSLCSPKEAKKILKEALLDES